MPAKTHGLYQTRIYKVWIGIKQRCLNPNDGAYPDYGGRGITICNEWRTFPPFYAWVTSKFPDGNVPTGLSIDRFDNDGPYAPWNCRWATRAEQNRNSRHNRFVEFNGQKLCLMDWANQLGISYHSLSKRLQKWPIDRALTEQKNHFTGQRLITHAGRTQFLFQWANEIGISLKGLSSRLNRGWSVDHALTVSRRRSPTARP